jgi:type III secretory pathway component EscS
MDLTTTFIVLQTGWDMLLVVLFSIILAIVIGLLITYFQDDIT